MHGIAGIFAFGADAPPVNRGELARLGAALPGGAGDGGGWIAADGRIGLAGRSGRRPGLQVVLAGAIVNRDALRCRLPPDRGRADRDGDAGPLAELYAGEGAAMVTRLRGGFAFALWDQRARTLLLARDGFGQRPLYLAVAGGTLRFASRVRALRAGGVAGAGPCAAGHVGFFLWGHVPEPHTLYDDIRALPAGHTLTVATGRSLPAPACHFDPAAEVRATGGGLWHGGGPEDLRRQLAETAAVHDDPQAGASLLLSGGPASAALCGVVAGRRDGVETLTVGVVEVAEAARAPRDPLAAAEAVARTYRTRHRPARLARAEIEDRLDGIAATMDQPSVGGIGLHLAAAAARAEGAEVALAGLGGDALFQATDVFRRVPTLVRRQTRLPFVYRLGRPLRRLSAPAFRAFDAPKWAGVLEYGTHYAGAYLLHRALFMPWELGGLLDPEMVRDGWIALDPLRRLDRLQQGIEQPARKVVALELAQALGPRLRDAEAAGTASGIELRMPFADPVLFRALAPSLARTAGPDRASLAAVPTPPLPAVVGHDDARDDWLGAAGLRAWARRLYAASNVRK